MTARASVWAALAAATLVSLPTVATANQLSAQGRLLGVAGVGVDGAYDLTFRLSAAETGGDAAWEEVHLDVPVDGGVFSVGLGGQEAIPTAALASGEPAWLEVQVEVFTSETYDVSGGGVGVRFRQMTDACGDPNEFTIVGVCAVSGTTAPAPATATWDTHFRNVPWSN